MKGGETDPLNDLLRRIKLLTEEQAEACDIYVCATISYFEDDVQDVCSGCGVQVFRRPHGPTKPKRVCLNCALASLPKGGGK
jgi:hypothetical protein